MGQQGAHRQTGEDERARQPWLVSFGGVLAGFLVVLFVLVLVLVGRGREGEAHGRLAQPIVSTTSRLPDIPEPAVPADVRARLPRATTDHAVPGAPVDTARSSRGDVVNIGAETVGFDRPGGRPLTVIPTQQLGNATWLPVLGRERNWVRVRLPSRPNGATAWVVDSGRRTARATWSVVVSLGQERLTVMKAGRRMGSWEIGRGTDAHPTPVGQTFLLGGFTDAQQKFSPVIYALGVHSDTLDTYGGGPGTVAVHGWPDRAGRIGKVSHGCVRVPEAALDMFGKLPAGTPVTITK